MTDRRTDGRTDGQDEALPERLLALARDHNAPPPTPREDIWLRVQAARRKSPEMDRVVSVGQPVSRSVGPSVRQSVPRWAAWVTGIAALLIIGIGLGRLTVPAPSTGPSTIAAAPGDSGVSDRARLAYSLTAGQHLSRVETFLTAVRTSEEFDTTFIPQARRLLGSTRLLQDSPELDPRVRRLLSDLEDILVQIAQFNRSRGAEELDLITEGLEERQVLPRIRTAVPAGPARAL